MSTNIFEVLRSDHDRQRNLVARRLETTGDSEDRASIFDELRLEMSAHADMEERHLYSPMMDHDLSQEKARHSVAEHKELDDFLEELEEIERSSPRWLVVAKDMEHRLTHHLDEEEQEMFQVAGRVLTDTAKVELAGAYMAGMADRREG